MLAALCSEAARVLKALFTTEAATEDAGLDLQDANPVYGYFNFHLL